MKITKYQLRSSKVSEPLKFAFVSDLHNYPNEPVFEAIRAIDPDAVLVGGDFIQSKLDTRLGMAFLRYVSERWPVFCSSGKEHDFDSKLVKAVEDTGAVFLRNQSVRFKGITIGGLNTIPIMGKPREEKDRLINIDREWLDEFEKVSGYKLLLCHHPEYYDMFVREYSADLILAGHAHGGQIRILGRGLWAPGQGWFPKYTAGLYDGRLIVGRGIGNTHRVPRINNGPEILEIRLCPCPSEHQDK